MQQLVVRKQESIGEGESIIKVERGINALIKKLSRNSSQGGGQQVRKLWWGGSEQVGIND